MVLTIKKHAYISFLFYSIFSLTSWAQKLAQQYFLENSIQDSIERHYLDSNDAHFHATLKPFITGQTIQYANINKRLNRFYHQFTEMDIDFPHNRYQFTVLPLIDLEYGMDFLKQKPIHRLAGGALARIDINRDFSLQMQYLGGRNQNPNFLQDFYSQYYILPGEGRAYGLSNNVQTFDQLTGFISYSPHRLLNLQLGKGKHFIGNGYRSLLLSDVANNYPYFKLTTNPWKIQYQFMAAWFKDLYTENGIKQQYTNKYGIFHTLSWNISRWINFTVFENVIWQGSDSTRQRGFEPSYLNPVIFFRPVEYSLGSSDNSMLGANLHLKITKRLELYGQLALDEFLLKEIRAQNGWWANKYGLQAGIKYWYQPNHHSTFKFQVEYNYVRPYTYTHGSVQQNYAHFNQALAHPFGANFKEWFVQAQYIYKQWQLSAGLVRADIGVGTFNQNVGQNIFQSYTSRTKEFGNTTGQGQEKRLFNSELKLSYTVLPALNLRAELAYQQYNIQNKALGDWRTPAVYIRLTSSIYNRYRDVFIN
jgi:hypothetical protein